MTVVNVFRFICKCFIAEKKYFQALDLVDCKLVLAKRNHYSIWGVSNDWLESYLSNWEQYVSISGYDSGLNNINFVVPQESVLWPLLFLLYNIYK